jgi:DNA polymerase-3 subunit alpha
MCATHENFVHLHVHSHYSLLDGLSKVEDLVKKAKEYGMTALALTDHGAMYGAIEFYKACKDAGIKPIIGVETYIANRTRFDRDAQIDNKRYHLTLLARNAVGYKNLMKAVSKSYLEGFYYKPRMDKELLKEYGEGIICLSGCPGSEFISLLREHKNKEARDLIKYYIECFGKDHVFIEVMNHTETDFFNEWYKQLIPEMRKISEELELPMVGTWDSHYLCMDDVNAHNTLLKINTGGGMEEIKGNFSFLNQAQACEAFSDMPDVVANTAKVAELVDIEIDTKSWFFPAYPIPAGTTDDSELRRITYEGFERLGVEKTPEVLERVEYELKVISDKGYPSYFLCVSDFFRAAKELGIYGQTRGSAAGSMVAYLAGISNINPLKYGLLFERFLNPDRPSLPDIDMDFADDRRDEIITYARNKYGEAAVAQIGTFGTMAARGAVRDVARALGYPYSTGDQLSKMIPMGTQGFAMTLDRAMDMVPELKEQYDSDRSTQEIIDLAKKIEGNVRHISVHAAGVVISPTGRVDDFSPVQLDPKGEGKVITQYDMYSGDREGIINLPKFDFLGLRNLSILAEALDRIRAIRGIEIDIEKVGLDDKLTYELFGRGETVGVFQFASAGMQKWLKELQPSNLEDLIAMASLYRPGPMAFIPDYIERKHDPRKIKYPDPRMEAILSNTYGIIVYQEDVMRMATDLAGYTRGESDKFRKAVGKKIPEEMAKQKGHFIDGCIENGMKPDVAKELWDMIETFAAYGFNKSHSAVYALLAYRTAYLKAHYPAEFMTAILTCESDNLDTVTEMIMETKRMGFKILPPDVNESFLNFTVVVEDGVVTDKIRFGLRSIKNFGEEIGKAIIAERKANGRFTSLENFLERVTHKNMNKRSLEALIMTGAFDSFEERGKLLANMEDMIAFNKECAKDGGDQMSLFAGLADAPKAKLVMKDATAVDTKQRLLWEKELLGLYVSGHPLEKFADRLSNAKQTILQIKNDPTAGDVVIAGIVEDCKEILTKAKNEKMAFVRIADLTGSLECVVFPKSYEEMKKFCVTDKLVIVKGKISDRNGERSLLIDKMKELL